MIKLTALWGKKNAAGLTLAKNEDPTQKGDYLLKVGENIFGRLWVGKKPDKKGEDYLSGFFLDARCLVFKNDQKGNANAPTYRVLIAEATEQQQPAKERSQKIEEVTAMDAYGRDIPGTGEDDDLPF